MDMLVYGMNLGQFCAMNRKIKLGQLYQEKAPEIVELFREGFSYEGIVEEVGLLQTTKDPLPIHMAAIGNALRGVEGRYEGLLNIEEFEKYSILRREINCSMGGQTCFEEGKGIFAASENQKKIWQSNGGSACFEKKSGMYARNLEERLNDSSKGGKKSALKKGFPAWDKIVYSSYHGTRFTREELVYLLSFENEFKHGSKVSNKKIHDYLKKYSFDKRMPKPSSISQKLLRFQEKIDKTNSPFIIQNYFCALPSNYFNT